MATVAVTRLVQASAEELWRVFTDLPGRSDWLSTISGIEVLTPVRRGSARSGGRVITCRTAPSCWRSSGWRSSAHRTGSPSARPA